PFGRVRAGVGNGDPNADHPGAVDGVLSGRLIGTYLHGPVLARNPDLADVLVRGVVGDLPAPPGEREAALLEGADGAAADLRRERLEALGRSASSRRPRAVMKGWRRISQRAAPSETG